MEKHIKKIQKLIALSQSDNPHESARARAQAEKLMSKYNIDRGDVDIVSTEGKKITGRAVLKESESVLISAISSIAGVCVSIQSSSIGRRSKENWLRPIFSGIKQDSEIALYCWDVLLSQMHYAAKEFKEKRATACKQRHIDQFCLGWAHSSSTKLVDFFGSQSVPDRVKSFHQKANQGRKTAKVGSTPSACATSIMSGRKSGLQCTISSPVAFDRSAIKSLPCAN